MKKLFLKHVLFLATTISFTTFAQAQALGLAAEAVRRVSDLEKDVHGNKTETATKITYLEKRLLSNEQSLASLKEDLEKSKKIIATQEALIKELNDKVNLKKKK